jgi:hypothetical protein
MLPPKKITPKSNGMPLGAAILRCIENVNKAFYR